MTRPDGRAGGMGGGAGMDASGRRRLVDRANLVPVAAMSAFWLAPMLRFWGAAFGPLKPHDAPAGDTAPPIVAFLAGFAACLLPWWLPASYLRPGGSARARRVYEALGVRRFRRLVPNGDLVQRAVRGRYPGYRYLAGRDSLRGFLEESRASERGHLVLLLMGLATAGYALAIGWHAQAAWLTAGNVAFNLYPILLQRYHRARIRPRGLSASRPPRA